LHTKRDSSDTNKHASTASAAAYLRHITCLN
jgi:hypothetical protein